MRRRTIWIAKDIGTGQHGLRHLEELERELKESNCPRLKRHIRTLKMAWGQGHKAPNPRHHAA